MIDNVRGVSPRPTIAQIAGWIRFILPEGRPLDSEAWSRRHTGIVILLWLHALGVFGYSLLLGNALPHSIFEGGLIAAPAMLAGAPYFSPTIRSILASFGLLNASAVLVHLSGGIVEMHFHYFVIIPIIALYQNWRPFLFAIGYVLVEHAVFGLIDPAAIYRGGAEAQEPLKWAAIHSAFVLAATVACVINWRVIEAAESHTQHILNAAGEGIYGVDTAGRITFVNKAAERLLGWSSDELIGKPAHTMFHSTAEQAANSNINKCPLCAGGADSSLNQSGSRRFRRKDGASFLTEYNRQPLLTPRGVTGVVVTFSDISDKEATREALKRSEQYYRSMFENAHDAIMILDPDREIVLDANQRAWELYGYNRDEFIGMSLEEVSLDKENGRRAVAYTLGNNTINMELQQRRKDGVEIFTDINATLIENGGKTTILSINRDITERKRIEQERAAKQAAEAASLAKTQFLSRMSHELRTPLNAILGFGQILEMEDLPDEQQESVGYIMQAGKHLLSLINEALDIARIEEGRLELSIETVSVIQVLQDTLNFVNPLSRQNNVTINVDLATFDDLFVYGDMQRFKQALLNVLANAVKYNRRGGSVAIKAQVTENSYARISVSDTGSGIAPQRLAKLFTPFERLGAEQSDIEGTGLGLALSQRLMEAMGGRIGVADTSRQGSTFWLELPLSQAGDSGQTENSEINIRQERPETDATFTVLYIEDNISNVKLVESILIKRTDIRLVTSRVPLDPQLVLSYAPDLILLDLHLPERSGQEVLRELKAEPQTHNIPVVIVSADATPGQIERLLADGAYAYLTKPLDVRQLLRLLDKVLLPPVLELA